MHIAKIRLDSKIRKLVYCQLINMFKYTKHTLKKLEELFKEVEYTIRYEKGNFKSGYCIVENRKIAVINKFFDTEARINCLLEILPGVEVDVDALEEKSAVFYQKLMKITTSEESDEEISIESGTEK